MPNELKIDDKYKTSITIQNDSVDMVGGQKAYYNPDKDAIYVKKGDLTWDDFGFKNAPQEMDTSLTIIHERQHQINAQKGVHKEIMSLDENYQRMVHDEITALIAEKLEVRRQYKACKTDEERAAFFKKFNKAHDVADYVNAIKQGKIDPNSTSSADFNKEMAFIKDSSIRYRADPDDSSYKNSWTANSKIYLATHGDKIHSNPEGLKKSVELMYENIGGINFNKIGNQNIHVIDNQAIQAADNMLQQGADPKKLIRFMNLGKDDFKIAESLDVTGLNQEQAEKVLQTAIITQSLSQNVSGDLALGEEPTYDYSFVSSDARQSTAIYLDLKSDIWEKNGTLTEEGDEEKFNELMKKAKEFQLDTEGWYNGMGKLLNATPEEKEKIAQKVKEMQGKIVNFDDVVKDQEDYQLPLDGTSKQEVIAEMDAKEEKDAKFWEEYYKKNPPKEPRISEAYQIDVMDLNSDILKDELLAREEAERQAEEERKRQEEEERKRQEEQHQNTSPETTLADNTPEQETPSAPDNGITIRPAPYAENQITAPLAVLTDNGNEIISTPKYDNAELINTTDENGNTTFSTLIDGQKHGVEYTKDKNGNIINFAAYNHGMPLDLSNYSLEIKTDTRNGITHDYAMLNGHVFGSEVMIDKEGNMTVAFYDALGTRIEEKATAKISQKIESLMAQNDTAQKDSLRADLKAQTGALPTNPTVLSQNLRFEWHQQKTDENKEKPSWVPAWQQSAEFHGLTPQQKETKTDEKAAPLITPDKSR